MNKLKAIIFVLSLGAIVTLQSSAGAQPCPAGCGVQKRSCVQTQRAGRLVCKRDCRANTEPTVLGACVSGCSSTYLLRGRLPHRIAASAAAATTWRRARRA